MPTFFGPLAYATASFAGNVETGNILPRRNRTAREEVNAPECWMLARFQGLFGFRTEKIVFSPVIRNG